MDLVRVRMEANWSGRLPKRHQKMFDLHSRQWKEGRWDSQSCYTDRKWEGGGSEECVRLPINMEHGMHGNKYWRGWITTTVLFETHL
jgi:hypothetical protein